MANIDEIIGKFTEQQEAARLSNEQRYAQALAIYDKIISQYQPGGEYLKGAEAELEREKGRTVAAETQDLISSGLFGTSITAGLGQKWEAEVGMPARLKLEDVRMGRLAQALGGKATAIQAREDIGPDYATVAQLAAQASNQPSRRTGSYATGGRGGGGQGSTRPSPYTSSFMPTGGSGGSGGRGFGGRPTPQYQYVKGPPSMSQAGMEMSRSGATYMGGGTWRYSGDLAEAHGAVRGYATPEQYRNPYFTPFTGISPYESVSETMKKYSYNPYA